MARAEGIHDLIDRLSVEENAFLAREFLAPVTPGGGVQVRIAGILCRLRIEPGDFLGWGVFQPVSHHQARLVRSAKLAERQRYLALFPKLRIILCHRDRDGWQGIPAHQGDRRYQFQGLVPVRLVEDGQVFEVVQCRFDGSQVWFEQEDPRRDSGTATYLRLALGNMEMPDKISRPGLTAEERNAYAVAYWPRYQAELEARRDRTEEQLRQALAHAGAEFRAYLERDDSYRVEYVVDGERHVSMIDKDLGVESAGICLSGEDHLFDLQSLVGVIREAQGGGFMRG